MALLSLGEWLNFIPGSLFHLDCINNDIYGLPGNLQNHVDMAMEMAWNAMLGTTEYTSKRGDDFHPTLW